MAAKNIPPVAKEFGKNLKVPSICPLTTPKRFSKINFSLIDFSSSAKASTISTAIPNFLRTFSTIFSFCSIEKEHVE